MTVNTELQAALEVVRANFQQQMRNLEAVNIGSAYKTKDEIIHWVSETAIETRNFIVYGLSLIEYINQGGTVEQFIDNELDLIASMSGTGHDKGVKERRIKLLYILYPQVAEKIEEI